MASLLPLRRHSHVLFQKRQIYAPTQTTLALVVILVVSVYLWSYFGIYRGKNNPTTVSNIGLTTPAQPSITQYTPSEAITVLPKHVPEFNSVGTREIVLYHTIPQVIVQKREDPYLSAVATIARFDFDISDHIYFFHIPKTAGSAFSEVLRYLKMCEKPGGCGQPIKPDGTPDFEHPVTGMEEECCCIHTCIGHFPYSDIQKKRNEVVPVDKDLYSVTILREPVSRVTSEYWYLDEIIKEGLKPQFLPRKHYPKMKDGSMTISKFVGMSDAEMKTGCCATVNNRQTMMLAGIDLVTAEAMGEEGILDLAKKNLLGLDYFGVSHRWDDSLELILWTFGQGYRKFTPTNLTWSRVHPHPKPTETENEEIAKANTLDKKLLQYADEVFEERMKIMRAHKQWVKEQMKN
eukprot:TRINITY_DN656_c0_g2_i1.p1 TRINITY_DN656_c0_g2~~TRINITY_DN656_c0_g2_i1.p1  ORF type:complete len:405 (+),score=60.20 TRINITY_DN656_c0_g2_i1:347-1561(+)